MDTVIPPATASVLERFNRAFLEHDPSLLPPLIAPGCVIERATPDANGTHFVGRDACLASWQALAADRAGSFILGETWVFGDCGLIFWEYRVGGRSRKGLNVMRVQGGLVVEARGYLKGQP
ncbi:MAG: nuclear transport factor 2 family protein [Burkholderiaceae bacterium]